METISIFDIFKIGIGPSSSHTLGPWRAAMDFLEEVKQEDFNKIEICLYGSLSKTGKGHATDKAIQLGLLGYHPEKIKTKEISLIINNLKRRKQISISKKQFYFNPKKHIIFKNKNDPKHPNTLKFKVYSNNKLLKKSVYYSIGGGFILKKGRSNSIQKIHLPYPINSGEDLKKHIKDTGMSIPEIVMQNEKHFKSEKAVKKNIKKLFNSMKKCVLKGVKTNGILPGGLQVVRRSKVLVESLTSSTIKNWKDIETAINSKEWNFNEVNQWVSCFAMAVNEENAAMGRIVTAPTNGAAGVIPSVLLYYYFFCEHKFKNDIDQFFLVAGEIGSLFKKGATISAAMGGCQAEIGVSSAMSAGALTKVLGGNYRQVLMASEIAMEHHLGLTCDPIGGLVQIPCIERNSMGAMKAITAANLALSFNPSNSKVDLDTVIKTMWETAKSMDRKYKETSEGGLALNISVISPEC
jgi:L-serine dehydratase